MEIGTQDLIEIIQTVTNERVILVKHPEEKGEKRLSDNLNGRPFKYLDKQPAYFKFEARNGQMYNMSFWNTYLQLDTRPSNELQAAFEFLKTWRDWVNQPNTNFVPQRETR